MKIELQAAQDETIAANHALQSVSGPEVFIVEKMKKQQERISSSNRQVVELQQENISVKREVNALRQENQELREEMRIVLAGRKQLEEMRKRVEQMRHASGGSGGSVDISNRAVVDRDVEEERDEVAAVLSTSYSSISSLPVGSPRVREVSFEDGPARVGGGGLVIQGSGSRRWHSKK
jgi:seryl-tRNA synthetase